MEEEVSVGGPELDPRNRSAAWWCWLLVVFALLPYDRIIPHFLPAKQREAIEKAPEVQPGSGEWALFKFQAEILIGYQEIAKMSSFPGVSGPNEDDLADQLKDLADQVSSDRQRVAVFLLGNFLGQSEEGASPDDDNLLEKLPNGRLRELAAQAVETGLDDPARGELRSLVGWFAGLAPSEGLGEPPENGKIRSRALVVLVLLSFVVMGGLCFLAVGASILVYHVSTTSRGTRTNAFRPSGWKNGYLFEAFALYLGLMTLGALVGAFFGRTYLIAGYGVAVLLPLFWPKIRGVSWTEFREAIGWNRGNGWLREIGAGFVGYLGLLSVASIGVALTAILSYIGQTIAASGGESDAVAGQVGPEAHPIVGWVYTGGFVTKIACLLLASGYAPFFEETFFRGTFHRYLRERMHFMWAALIAGVIFAALHPQGFFAIPALASMGIGFAIIREWRDSLVAPMVAHAINNGVLVILVWTLF